MIVRATSLEGLFEAAALSMIHIMLKFDTTNHATKSPLSAEGQDLEDLMVRWLGEVLYLFEGEKMIPVDVDVMRISSTSGSHAHPDINVEAMVSTIPFDPQVHELLCEIKAVTYHQIEVRQKNSHWETRVIFDL